MLLQPVFRIHVAALLLALCGGIAAAQESSVITLEAPTGESSGETIPEQAAPPSPCGTQPITIARMQWPTSALLAEIHARILSDNFSCTVQLQESDMATVGSSMGSNGQPAVAPEMWIARIPEIWNAALENQKVRQGGASYLEPIFEGWFVPAYVAETWPDIASIEGLKVHAAEMGNGRRPRFITCPPDWGCNIINANMLRAHGLDGLFEVVEPANRFELDTLIAEAVGRKEPILFYYWQPNAILAQFSFREVALGSYNKDNFLCMGRRACATPLPSSFAPDPVVTAVSDWVFVDAPQVASYFQRAKMPFAEMNAMLQQMTEAGVTVEQVAERFIAERGAIWRPWAGLPVEPATAEEPAQ
jgi:glycine betaine/proline transport system substrate-binding protein